MTVALADLELGDQPASALALQLAHTINFYQLLECACDELTSSTTYSYTNSKHFFN